MIAEFVARLFTNPNLAHLNAYRQKIALIDFINKHPQRMYQAMHKMQMYSHLTESELLDLLRTGVEAHSEKKLIEEIRYKVFRRIDVSPLGELGAKVDRDELEEKLLEEYKNLIPEVNIQEAVQAIIELTSNGVIDKYILAAVSERGVSYSYLFRIWKHKFDPTTLKEFLKATALLLPFYFEEQLIPSVSSTPVGVLSLLDQPKPLTALTQIITHNLQERFPWFPKESFTIARDTFSYTNPELANTNPGAVFLGALFNRFYQTAKIPAEKQGSDKEWFARFKVSSSPFLQDMERIAFVVER